MNFPEEQIEELKQICPDVKQVSESGITYFYLPDLPLPEGCTPEKLDALLCPTGEHGYTSRLFLPQQISAPQARNWSTNVRILERMWWAISWNIPQPNQRLAQILLGQLGAFR